MRFRSVKSIKDELIKKSREAMLAAVQIYNNPLITFKAESFITLAIIAWTYLMHSYYRDNKINYCYFKLIGNRRKFEKTKNKAKKHWELERCIDCDQCPLDNATKNNLHFLIGIRHEIEHQMTKRIDDYISAKLQACSINYDYYLRTLFGDKYSLSKELSISIQFSSINPAQEEALRENPKMNKNIKNFISSFEKNLSITDFENPRYAYRVLYSQINSNRVGQADNVIEFVKPGSETSKNISAVLVKTTEKTKYSATLIIEEVHNLGLRKFNMFHHTKLWKEKDAKNPNKSYGVMVIKRWLWYQSWLDLVLDHCKKNAKDYQ